MREGVMHRYDERGRLTQKLSFGDGYRYERRTKEFFTEQRTPEEMPLRAKATNQYFERGGSQY